MQMMKKLKLDKNLKSSLITYGMVIVAYAVMQLLVMSGNVSSLIEGLLVPLCIYSIMAVSLNLTVGILVMRDLCVLVHLWELSSQNAWWVQCQMEFVL